MAVGRISGPLLKSNLIRNGIDLAFETDLLYLDVNNQRIGVRTNAPSHDLHVNGTTRTTNLIVDNIAEIADITISGNTIQSANTLNLLTTGADSVVYQRQLDIQSISIFDNVINTNDSNANLELRPNGTGQVEVYSNLQVEGNIHATGNISADGNITLGDADTDNVTFNSAVASDIIPDQTDTYKLGNSVKRWDDVWLQNLNATTINSSDLLVDGIDMTLRQGNIYYVAENGDDTRTGTHPQDPFATIEQALSVASTGDTVYIYPGAYEEVFPLTVPVGVTVKGHSLRSVTITPTAGTNTNDAFLLNGETTVEDITIKDFYSPGFAFKFANNMTVTSRSPYIRNVTVITKGSVITAEDPRGFNAGDAGAGAYLDGSVVNANSKEASCLFHAVTFITPGVDTLQATNGVRVEWLNSFTYFANRGLYAFDGTAGKYNDGKTFVRLGGISGGTFQAGDTVTFTSTDSSTVLNVNVESVDNDVLVIDGKNIDFIDFDTTPQSISNGSGVTATTILNHDVRDFGAEIRMIGSASVYGNYGLYGDGPGVIVYAIGQNLAYIGNGKEVTNDPGTVLQDNEVIELNDAKIRYNSVDHKGDFRVGDLFYVNQDDGTVNFVANALNVDLTSGVTFTSGGNSTFVSGDRIDTGNLRISGNTIESLSGNINISPLTQTLNLNSDVNVAGSLDVTGNVTIGGNITIGDQATDTIQIVAGIDSDLIPNLDTTYNLGNPTKMWKYLYTNGADFGDIRITNNFIETTVSNADLELRASGTGKVLVPNANVEITNDLTVGGDSTFQDVDILGNLTIAGDITQTGNQTVIGDVTVGGNLSVTGQAQFEEILIDDNFITTTSSNADLELRANGTGEILIPNNTFRISNDLISNALQANTLNASTVNATEFVNGTITINNNNIQVTTADTDLLIDAAGTGDVKINSSDVVIQQNLTVNGATSLQNTQITGTVTHTGDTTQTGNFNIAGEISNGNILIEDNFITTTDSNSDLELRASGTGEILIPDNNVQINNNLTVSGTTDLQDTTVNGTFTLTGDLSQTGDATITGSVTVTQDLDVSGAAQFEEILIDDNFITTTTSNTNLELRASGTGIVLIPNANVEITNDLDVQGTLTVNDINSSGTITANRFSTGDILIDDNFITTTQSNSNLELRANGTGEIIVPNNDVTFQNTVTVEGLTTLSDTTVNGTLQIQGNVTHTGDIQVIGTSTLDKVVVNQTLQLEEILIDDNFITTTSSNADLELSANGTGQVIVPNNDVVITNDLDVNGTFTVNNINSSGTITANSYSTGDILIDDNFITTTLSNSDLELRANGTGEVLIPNNDVQIDNNLNVDGVTTLSNTTINGTFNHTGDTVQVGNYTQTGNANYTGNLVVSGDSQFENIQITGNVIQTTLSNSDLEFKTSGTGSVLIPSADVDVTGNLTVVGQLTVGDIQSTGTIEANNFTTGDILIDDNFITTTTSNSDLELRANGTGIVVVQDNLQATQDLTVSGNTTLNSDVTVNGAVTHTGTTVQTGNYTQTGTTDITGNLTVTGDADFEGIRIAGNSIIGTQSNADIEIKTSGTGDILFPNNDLQVTNDFVVGGTLTVGNLTATGIIEADSFTTGDILIDDNFITTTLSNSNLELRANGTGGIIAENFTFNESTITTTTDDMVISPATGYTKFTGTGAINVPVGTTLQRPSSPQVGQIRYNQDLSRYEGYNGTNWIILQGVEDLDGNTRVTAELVEGQNDNIIRFYTDNTVRANIDSNRFYADRFEVDDVQIEQNTISTLTTDQDLVLSAAGTGRVVIENFAFEDNRIINTVSNSITLFENTNNGYVKFSGTGGLVIPSGTSAERPAVAYREIGMARFNTEDDRVEIFDGVNWASSAGAGSGINPADAADLAIETVLYLG